MKRKVIKSILLIFMLTLTLFSVYTFKASDYFLLSPQIKFYGSNDNWATYNTISTLWLQEDENTFIFDADGAFDFQNGLKGSLGNYQKYRITATQTDITNFQFISSGGASINYDINYNTLEFSNNTISSNPDNVSIDILYNGKAETIQGQNFSIRLIKNNYIPPTTTANDYINQGWLKGYQEALDNINWIDENDDNYDDISFNAGRLSGIEENNANKTLIGFAGSILGAGLSFVLFLATEFDIFGVNLLTIFLGFIAVIGAIFIIKKVL